MLRLPQNLSTQLSRDSGPSVLEAEVLAEKAASLGRAARSVEKELHALACFGGNASERPLAVKRAADAVYAYFVQRELCGFMSHDDPISHYGISREVLARVGSR